MSALYLSEGFCPALQCFLECPVKILDCSWCLSDTLKCSDDMHDRWGRNRESRRTTMMQMEDLQRQLQQEAAKRVAAEQQAAKLKQQVERLQAENMQSAVSALAALQHMDQKSKNMQAEVGEIKGSLQAEIAEVVRRKGTEVAALQEQMAVLRVGGFLTHLLSSAFIPGNIFKSPTTPWLQKLSALIIHVCPAHALGDALCIPEEDTCCVMTCTILNYFKRLIPM